jgi:hypothetical protein
MLGTVADVSANNLLEAGWGVIFPSETKPEIEEALNPLLKLRKSQCPAPLFRIFKESEGYRQNDTASAWLSRRPRNATLGPVDPFQGVPFYLLIVGSPDEIPFDFQYTLDVFFGVGRLFFADASAYRCYAESVVRHETSNDTRMGRSLTIFAPRHDPATELFAKAVVTPLAQGDGFRGPLAEAHGFKTELVIEEAATTHALASIFRPENLTRRSALLLTGSHGATFTPEDPNFQECQGALVCQDWPGHGKIALQQCFRGSDIVKDADLTGLIHFAFACYSGGWSDACSCLSDGPTRSGAVSSGGIARLPQAMLCHPGGGALAVIAHVDFAWAYSFVSDRGAPQLQAFRDVLIRLMKGDRVGLATDQFNLRWAVLYKELATVRQQMEYGITGKEEYLGQLWIAHEDARNYIVLGDPAVQLKAAELDATEPLNGD